MQLATNFDSSVVNSAGLAVAAQATGNAYTIQRIAAPINVTGAFDTSGGDTISWAPGSSDGTHCFRIYVDGSLYEDNYCAQGVTTLAGSVGTHTATIYEIDPTGNNSLPATWTYTFWSSPVYVDGTNGNDANSGSSWSDALQTIQAAVNFINGNSIVAGAIWIAQGTYNESLTLPTIMGFFGGFTGGESTLTDRPAGAVSTITPPTGSHALTCNSGSNFRLDGLAFVGANITNANGADAFKPGRNKSCYELPIRFQHD